MNSAPLSKIDLNLLVVLDVLLRERSVGKTAERLNLTSSAVSHALRRLRTVFDNELLIRDGHRMVPTARALALADSLPALLHNIERTLAEPEAFDPATSTRVFRLAAPDFLSSLLPHLLKVTSEEAPEVSVEFSAYSPAAALDMQQGRFDALIAPAFKQTDDLRGEKIGVWPWKVYGRKNHPAFAQWSLEAWARFPHLQVSSSSPSGKSRIDQTASQLGVSRHIGAVVTHFAMAAPILAQTDMLLSVPSVAMQETAAVYGLDEQALPFHIPPIEFMLFRSATSGDKTDIRWFHNHLATAAQAFNDSQ